jgi:hypothetical protein
MATDFITVSDEVRAQWDAATPAAMALGTLNTRLDDINFRIRALLMSMAGRNIKTAGFSIRLAGDHNEVLHV